MEHSKDMLKELDKALASTPEERIAQFMKTANELHVILRNAQVHLETPSEQTLSSVIHDLTSSQSRISILSILYGIVLAEKAKLVAKA